MQPMQTAQAPAAPAPQPTPSKVIHMRNVGPEISQTDLLHKNQALLQFHDIQSAIQFMEYNANQQVNVRGRNVYMQFSSHQELTTQQNPDANTTSRILLVTIQNPLYPITVDVLSQVFSPFETDPRGTVEKIVIFTKQAGLQALIQYSNNLAAAHAKNSLDGKNIYANCCTLQIQFSNLSELTVRENSEKSRDFTNPSLPVSRATPPLYGQLAATQQMMGAQTVMAGQQPGQFGYGTDKSCLIVSGLSDKLDCDRLFNLFSNYGNIVRIKLLHNKPGVALIQMGDNMQATSAMSYLKGLRLFDSAIDINFSRYSTISPPAANSDGRTKDYTTSPLNRFMRTDSKNFRHISAPSCVLHVSNLAPTTTTEQVVAHLAQHAQAVASRMLPDQQLSQGAPPPPTQRKQALVQFATVEQASEVLCLLHNSQLDGQNIRLAFSKNTI